MYIMLTRVTLQFVYCLFTYIHTLLHGDSWSSNWGMNGYIMMTRGNYNQCGIATDASYPTL